LASRQLARAAGASRGVGFTASSNRQSTTPPISIRQISNQQSPISHQ
jgi:hypothetical protein